ncbi:hypothetical protein BT63DRAFT_462186 [Microthyrium microscopicum]|uniref:Uncharacterized protein n=1 Tax=Microthyrium microscopicum TaxID=703497 RepID=A0A6A6UT76_9PEZI|nr:hypothetical protein BT63DRAFT_462186 [Microthyrium microscopicum]
MCYHTFYIHTCLHTIFAPSPILRCADAPNCSPRAHPFRSFRLPILCLACATQYVRAQEILEAKLGSLAESNSSRAADERWKARKLVVGEGRRVWDTKTNNSGRVSSGGIWGNGSSTSSGSTKRNSGYGLMELVRGVRPVVVRALGGVVDEERQVDSERADLVARGRSLEREASRIRGESRDGKRRSQRRPIEMLDSTVPESVVIGTDGTVRVGE